MFTTVLVFSFVALWHDLSFRLLAWGWLVSLFILPELAARYLLPATKVSVPHTSRFLGAKFSSTAIKSGTGMFAPWVAFLTFWP